MSRETADATEPSALPTISSVEPPPMSTTSTGSAAGRTRLRAPTKESWASVSPLITSGSTPSRSWMPAKKTSRLRASREAEVATKRIRLLGTPASRIRAA